MCGSLKYVLLLIAMGTVAAEKVRYDHYQVFSIQIDTAEQRDKLNEHEGDYSMWTPANAAGHAEILVPPHKVMDFYDLADSLNMKRTVTISNVQSLIDTERPMIQPRAFGWTDYQTYASIYEWLDAQLAANPTILTNYVVGTSYENRLIRAVKLSHKAGNPAIFIEANIHAREWITSATATWILNELLTSTDPTTQEIAQNIDWIIVPVLNVDGFVYTHERNRLWRKTRQPHSIFCIGADPNRNFYKDWRQKNGASNNPCTETYAGPYPGSEPEVEAFTRFYESVAGNVKMYLDFHSAGQYLMTPYGSKFTIPPNHYELMTIAIKGKDAIKVRFGSDYLVGPIAEVLYEASGSSIDWAYGIQNMTLIYAFEFRDVRGGIYGQLLPADQIIPNSLEVFDGIKAMIAGARDLGYM